MEIQPRGPAVQSNGMATTAPQTVATPTVDNNIAATQAANASFAAQNPNVFGPSSTSTTAISNSNKIDQVPGIVNKTNELAKTGVTTDANGNAVYSNGTSVPQTPETPPYAAPKTSSITSTGGYVGDVYYAPGADLPVGTDGKPVATTVTSPTDDTILNSLNDLKAQTDATTASLIDGIHSQYAQLRQQQEQANKGQEAGVNNALLMGGVTGQGSSAQYAPVSSSGIVQAQVSYGLQQIADLNSKEQSAIIQAQIAGQQQKFQVQDKINQQIDKIRDEKVAAAVALNEKISLQNEKLAAEKLQASKDEAVANLYSSGVTDPNKILKTLNDQGLTINSTEIANTLKNVNPDADTINQIALTAAQNGATPEVLAKLKTAKTAGDAISIASDSLGAEFKSKMEQIKFDNDIKLQQVAMDRAQLAISRANLGVSQGNLALSQRKQALEEAKASGLVDADGNPSKDLVAYAQQYASNGQIPSGIPDGSFGAIAEVAKSLPKQNGTLVEKNTGVKPSTTTVSDTTQQGIVAMYDIVDNKLPELLQKFNKIDTSPLGKLGSIVYTTSDRQDFRTLKTEVINLLLKARSGATVTPQEYDRYYDMLPSELSVTGVNKLNSLYKDLSGNLNSQLNANGLSIYGYSSVSLPDGKNYKVGDNIEVGGKKYRVNSDGSLLTLN